MKKYALPIMLSFAACTPAFAQASVAAAPDQLALLKSSDPREAANKKLVFDFLRVVLDASHLEEVEKYVSENYVEHNPTSSSGRDALIELLKAGRRGEIQPTIRRSVVAITADGDIVTFAFAESEPDPCTPGRTYTTTQFDMFRVANGKIVEHWDDTRLGIPLPGMLRPCLNSAAGPAAPAGVPDK